MNDYVINKAHLRLRSGVLAQLPLLYTAGEIVIHNEFGPCKVLEVAREQRLIQYIEPLPMPKKEHQRNLRDDTMMWGEHTQRAEAWVHVDALRWLDIPKTHLYDREALNLMDVRCAWLKTLSAAQQARYTKGVDYAALRFDQRN